MTTNETRVHTAFKDYPDGRVFAASVDGETWIAIDRKAEPDDYEQIASMTTPSNPGPRTVLMARRYLIMNGWTIE